MLVAGMAAGAGRHQDQPVDPGLHGLSRVAGIDDVVKDHAAIAVHGVDHVLDGAQRGDDQGHLVLYGQLDVGHQARIGIVDDQVDAEGCVLRPECRLDLLQPLDITLRRALVQRRERADHTGLAGGDDQGRAGDQEHRRGNRRETQVAAERRRNHGGISSELAIIQQKLTFT